MKAFPHFLVAGLVVIGTACSSTNTTTNATPSTDADAANTRMGTDMNPTPAPDANSGMAPNGALTTPSAGVTSTTTTDAAADPTAFMGTFASMKDPAFLLTAASSNMLEIQAGQMAAQKATNPEVRKYAEMMVSQHTKSTQELKAVAVPLGVKMPQTMMPVHQAMADRLMNKSGKDFDETYMDMMETAHKMDIALFEAKSKSAETPTVKDFAAATLPMLRSHHTMANDLEKKVD